MRKVNLCRFCLQSALVICAVAVLSVPALAKRGGEGGRTNGPVIYVDSQGLFYDTIVTADPLPPHGPFQELYMGPNGPTTDVGPGDPGYVGGRWWVDTNGNGHMDPDDHYFLCPLLGPGRIAP